jgi:hypothetical protein
MKAAHTLIRACARGAQAIYLSTDRPLTPACPSVLVTQCCPMKLMSSWWSLNMAR